MLLEDSGWSTMRLRAEVPEPSLLGPRSVIWLRCSRYGSCSFHPGPSPFALRCPGTFPVLAEVYSDSVQGASSWVCHPWEEGSSLECLISQSHLPPQYRYVPTGGRMCDGLSK